MRIFTTDAIHGAVQKDGVSPTDGEGFTFDEEDTVTIDNRPWTDAFDTDQYHAFDVVVAKPIPQTYEANERIAAALDVDEGDVVTLTKPPEELRQSAWALDNSPTPITHPEEGVVSSPDQVHGFVRNPEWDAEAEELRAEGYVPTTDDFAKAFISEYGDVSVGFFNDIEPASDEEDVDGYQRSILYDHVAHVQHGRCDAADGCGVLRDDSYVGEDHAPTITEGQWVKWTHDDTVHHGRVTDEDGPTVHVYDGSHPTDETTDVALSNLEYWVGPNVDHCPGDTCSCGCHVPQSGTDSQGGNSDGCHISDMTTDAPSGIYVDDDGTWYGISPSETSDGEPKYPLESCNDVKDAYNLRNNGDYEVSTDTLVNRIQRVAEAKNCPPETRPWLDSTDDAITVDDEYTISPTTTMSDDNPDDPETGATPTFNMDDLSVDAVRARHDGVDEEFTEYESQIDSLESDLEEAESQRDAAQSTVEDLKERLAEFERDEAEEIVEDIVDLTDHWEKEAMLDAFDEGEIDLDRLAERRELATDLAATETTVGDSQESESTESTETTTDSESGGYTAWESHDTSEFA